jgi:hypothetical protein
MILSKVRYIPVPHTNENYLIEYLRKLNKLSNTIDIQFPPRSYYNYIVVPGEGMPTFTVITDPISWYMLYWRKGESTHWTSSQTNTLYKSLNFSQFIRKVEKEERSLYTKIIKETTDTYKYPIFRIEDLSYILPIYLKELGYTDLPKESISSNLKLPWNISEEDSRLIIEMETEIVTRFYREENA